MAEPRNNVISLPRIENNSSAAIDPLLRWSGRGSVEGVEDVIGRIITLRTARRYIEKNWFPPPIYLGGTTPVWKKSVILTWLDDPDGWRKRQESDKK